MRGRRGLFFRGPCCRLAPVLPRASAPLRELWPERVLHVRSNRGFTQQLLAAPVHAADAAARSLTPSSAQFGCLLNFLFLPTDAALQPLQRQHRLS